MKLGPFISKCKDTKKGPSVRSYIHILYKNKIVQGFFLYVSTSLKTFATFVSDVNLYNNCGFWFKDLIVCECMYVRVYYSFNKGLFCYLYIKITDSKITKEYCIL